MQTTCFDLPNEFRQIIGANVGGNGGGAEQFRRLASGELEALDPCALITLLDGETVVSISCGGGGYGPAHIIKDLVQHSTGNGWDIGPGRGSAGGSLVCYLLGIHSLDPLKWGLSSVRFMGDSRGGNMLNVTME